MNSERKSERGGGGAEAHGRSRDFILISEFSEQVGPVPVMVKPEGGGTGTFNTSSFSVRIMSSDMQRAMTGGCFSFSEDTQMVLSERKDGLFAYVHYFSLYDINARGYVRQFAISYITPSLKKITDNFKDFLTKFSEITGMLCCGNHKIFGRDVEHRLTDLEYTKELIEEEGWTDEGIDQSTMYKEFDFMSSDVPERDVAAVESGISEMSGIMDSLLKEKEKEGHRKMQLFLEKKRESCRHKYTSPPPLSSAISGSSLVNDAASFLAHTYREPSINGSPQSELSVSSGSSQYQPQRAMAHYIQRFERRLRDLKELSSYAYPFAIERLDSVYKHFSRSTSTLEMEKEEKKFIHPYSSLLTVGRVPVLNVLANVMTSSRPHLHAPQLYTLCCKEVDPRQRVLATPTNGLDHMTSKDDGFDKSFAEDSNALNNDEDDKTLHCMIYMYNEGRPLYLNPSLRTADNLLTPMASFSRPLPLISRRRMEEEEEEKEREEEDMRHGSSEEYQETSGASVNSPGFHTPQEFTPGNSPRTSTLEVGKGAESQLETSHTHRTTSLSPARSSPLLNSLSLSGAAHDLDHKQVLYQFRHQETGQDLDKPVLNQIGYRESDQESVQLPSIPDPPISMGDRDLVTELRDSATFSPFDEETSVAGCGSLNTSPRKQTTPDSEVIVREKTPPPVSLNIRTNSFSSPNKSQVMGPWSSVGSSSREMFSPSSLLMSPERGSRWPQILPLYSGCSLPFMSSLDQAEGDYRFKPGRGLARFCKDHTSTRDLLYCLLQGRPLVIIGEPNQENMIRRLVRVLWMFVPGHSSSHQVIPWRERPLMSDDIARIKLVGLSQNRCGKPQALPNHLKKHVSYWDCTPGTFRVSTPPYEGDLLKPILSRTRDRKNEATFLTQIHSVLSELAMLAYIYYHSYCLNISRQPRPFSPEMAPVRHHKVHTTKYESRKTRRQFLQQQLGLKTSDTDIIECFVAVMQSQQLEQQHMHRNPFNVDPVRVHLKHKLCQENYCKPKAPY